MTRTACACILLASARALAPAPARRTNPARHGAPKDGPSYADLPRDVEPIDTSFLEEKPPPSWGSEGWNWGSANGAAHDKAAIVRAQFAKRHRRTSFMAWAKCGTVDAGDLKMALALSCQRARNLGYDENGKWESLMDEMAACRFEGAEGPALLCDAIRSRLPDPPNAPRGLDPLPILVASAFQSLGFVERGL